MNSSIQYRTPNIETKGVVGFSTVNTVRKHCQFALGTNLVSSAPVQNLAIPHRVTDTSPLTVRHFQARFALSVLLLAALWVGLCRELRGEWSVNEQYNFGWFVPFFALYLFWLRWQDRPPPEIRSQRSETANNRRALAAILIAVPALLLLLPIRLFEIANPAWRPLGWIHASSIATLTLLYIWYTGGAPWLRHFAFPILFVFIAVPC